ncbi:hypothetical protein AAFF_G00075130 [Aldrovandia affinis]|uniref:ribonuclease H n=1 Tax=Aldrovandia affinis TaxID=143900 RepID=A0AAD7RY86_9TELE|nr:hypothetical protein AAFF_G00075130 [Aldrovandia affinis]
MERVLSHVPKQHCIVYLDDLLVHASDFEGALPHLWEVFAAIHQAGLRLNPKKCRLFRRETAFLGHVVSAGGVATDPAKITAVRDWPPPTNISDLRSFLGLASYYRRYPYVWDDPCAQTFNALRTAVITAPVLAYPDANRPFILDTDASNVGVGAVLSQPSDSGEQEAQAQLVLHQEVVLHQDRLAPFRPLAQAAAEAADGAISSTACLKEVFELYDPMTEVTEMMSSDHRILHALTCSFTDRRDNDDPLEGAMRLVNSGPEGTVSVIQASVRSGSQFHKTTGLISCFVSPPPPAKRNDVSTTTGEIPMSYSNRNGRLLPTLGTFVIFVSGLGLHLIY